MRISRQAMGDDKAHWLARCDLIIHPFVFATPSRERKDKITYFFASTLLDNLTVQLRVPPGVFVFTIFTTQMTLSDSYCSAVTV